MKHLVLGTTALILSGTVAVAGGLDRSGQSITSIFENGTYVELSFGQISPTVKGTMLGVPLPSGDVGPTYTQFGVAAKFDINDKLSMGIIIDQPFGADVSYETAGYPLDTSNAAVTTTAITVLGRYKISDAFSVHGGLRQVTASGHYDPAGPYASTYSSGSDTGYVLGAAFERPEIALRVALTYSSATSFTLPGTVGDVSGDMPQSVNLDFQTGVAANTLVFGSIRWADWTNTALVDSVAGTLIDYDHDVMTYSLGVGRKFSDSFSGALTLGYEKAQGGLASNLSPTDGYMSIGLGGTYTKGNMKITGGLRYVKLGDATTEPLGAFPGATFSGNSAVGVGVKVAFTF